MFSNRSGNVFKFFILTLIIMMVITLLFVVLFRSTAVHVRDVVVPSQQCKQSVLIHASTNIQNEEFIDHLNCETQYITVPGPSGRDEEQYGNYIKKTLADGMYYCYDSFWKGELDVFSADRSGVTKFCYVCSVFEFPEAGHVAPDFVSYLAKTPSPGDRKKSYFEFLTGHVAGPDVIDNIGTVEDDLTTNEPYAVVFTFMKNQDWSMFEKIGLGSVAGGAAGLIGAGILVTVGAPIGLLAGSVIVAAGVITGASIASDSESGSTWSSKVVLLPYDELYKLNCNELRGKQSKE